MNKNIKIFFKVVSVLPVIVEILKIVIQKWNDEIVDKLGLDDLDLSGK